VHNLKTHVHDVPAQKEEASPRPRLVEERVEPSSQHSSMLSKKTRIPRTLFSELIRSPKYANSANFSLRFAPLTSPTPRIGVSVSKKVSKSAVDRNTVRRRVYSEVRPFLPKLKGGMFLFVAKPSALTLKGVVLSNEIQGLFTVSDQFVS
jgi:ribonuclease P protein component